MAKSKTPVRPIPEADAAPLDTRVLWSIHQFHFETGRTRETIRKRLARSGVKPGGIGPNGHPLYRCFDVLPILYAADETGGIDPDKLDPHARHSHYKAESERRKLLVEAGELITREDYIEEMARVLRSLQQFADTIPDVLERDCGLTPDQVSRVEAQCDTLRNALADDLAKYTEQAAAISLARANEVPAQAEVPDDSPETPEAPTPRPEVAAPAAPSTAFDDLFG